MVRFVNPEGKNYPKKSQWGRDHKKMKTTVDLFPFTLNQFTATFPLNLDRVSSLTLPQRSDCNTTQKSNLHFLNHRKELKRIVV